MDANEPTEISRTRITIRLLFTIAFLIVFEILRVIVQLTVFFQFIYLFITKSHSPGLRNFTNQVCAYAYHLLRYVTLNENRQPFPLSDFPDEMEPPEAEVLFE
jgi:Domain of unknown function (DUF4389)